MGKIIFWLVVFFVALLVLRLINVSNSRRGRRDAGGKTPKAKDTAMIRCANCGVYLPRADAIESPRGPVCGDPQCLPSDARSQRHD
ncbi:MAG TPA: PP0621 family protein [Casimicrobiaceae bacterium]|jgi:uncharacterized protein